MVLEKKGNGYWQGYYIPENPHKYDGDINSIYARSSYEARVFRKLDLNPKIVKWSSEEIVIPYYDVIMKKQRNYFLDVYFKYSDGKEYYAEIKPKIKLTAKNKDRIETINIYNKAHATLAFIKELNMRNGSSIEFIFITE
jgi:hypothetical protein